MKATYPNLYDNKNSNYRLRPSLQSHRFSLTGFHPSIKKCLKTLKFYTISLSYPYQNKNYKEEDHPSTFFIWIPIIFLTIIR